MTDPVASLGMYDSAATAGANDRLWALIRESLADHGISAPAQLTRGEAAYWPAWTSPDLLLSQTCGYPYRARLCGEVQLLGAPDHRLDATPPGWYRSVMIARDSDPRGALRDFDGAPFAYNDALSQSGWAGPVSLALSEGIRLRPAHSSGGHRASAAAVRAGLADIAGIDAVTWAMMAADDSGGTLGLRVICHTPPAPALPFITGPGRDRRSLQNALATAISALAREDRETLHLFGLIAVSEQEYLSVPTPPPPGG